MRTGFQPPDPARRRELLAFFDVAVNYMDHSIRANRREDGLYHSYNLMKVDGDRIVIAASTRCSKAR